MDHAFRYAETHQMDLESDYRYTAKNGVCKAESHTGVFTVKSYHDVRRDSVDALTEAVNG